MFLLCPSSNLYNGVYHFPCEFKCRLLSLGKSTIRDLKIGSSRKPRTSRGHVTSTLQVCGLRFTFVRLDHALEVGDLPQGFFLHPTTSQSHIWEKTLLLELFCLSLMEFFLRNVTFKDNFSAKIKVNEWMNTNMEAARYHLGILSPKYGQASNVEQHLARRGLPFAVRWPHLDLKVSIIVKTSRDTSKWRRYSTIGAESCAIVSCLFRRTGIAGQSNGCSGSFYVFLF